MFSQTSPGRARKPGRLTDRELTTRVVSPRANCAGTAVDPDEWFPVATAADAARSEAARALALCAVCPVRAECLELSMRRWNTIGRHGIWGGFVEAERGVLRARWLAGTPITRLLRSPALDLTEHHQYRQREVKDAARAGEPARARQPVQLLRPAVTPGGYARRVRPAGTPGGYGRTAPSKLAVNQPLNATFSTTAPVCGASISIPPPT